MRVRPCHSSAFCLRLGARLLRRPDWPHHLCWPARYGFRAIVRRARRQRREPRRLDRKSVFEASLTAMLASLEELYGLLTERQTSNVPFIPQSALDVCSLAGGRQWRNDSGDAARGGVTGQAGVWPDHSSGLHDSHPLQCVNHAWEERDGASITDVRECATVQKSVINFRCWRIFPLSLDQSPALKVMRGTYCATCLFYRQCLLLKAKSSAPLT